VYEERDLENDYSGAGEHSDGGFDGTGNDVMYGQRTVLKVRG
jgi:hypothetical protein